MGADPAYDWLLAAVRLFPDSRDYSAFTKAEPKNAKLHLERRAFDFGGFLLIKVLFDRMNLLQLPPLLLSSILPRHRVITHSELPLMTAASTSV